VRALAAGALLPLVIAPAAADSGKVDQLLAKHLSLAQGDGIAAEAQLRDARVAGARDDTVRALMGEALRAQGNLARARKWLAPARFFPRRRVRWAIACWAGSSGARVVCPKPGGPSTKLSRSRPTTLACGSTSPGFG
jgi:hypothetical protein